MALHIELGDIGHQLLVGRGCAEVALQNVRHLRITHARNMPGVPSPDIGINQANVRFWPKVDMWQYGRTVTATYYCCVRCFEFKLRTTSSSTDRRSSSATPDAATCAFKHMHGCSIAQYTSHASNSGALCRTD